jgi:hypothetical protein
MRPLQGTDDAALSGAEQAESVIERARLELHLCGGEGALRAARGFGCQRGGAFEERRGGGKTASRPRPGRRTFQVGGNVLVGRGGRLRPVPGAAIRVEVRVGRFGERPVDLPSLLECGGAVDR